ncbi:glutathione S-transferase 1 [Ditylenchus destructor]|uniref:glutathione transferase n=1 Tax=Ditylenchus destructor TaxID=166010 RepID=A0AAD4N3L6_9BILA|nr:glutathione S-transferase 1 [Ditylenchus destructor]
MLHYKLIGFVDVRGLAEMSRCVLHYAGVRFEDYRIPLNDWPILKKTMPYEQLPKQILCLHNFKFTFKGLAGESDLESALLDSVADLHKDFQNEIASYFMVGAGFQEGDKDKIYKETFLPAAERHFPRLVKLLNESGSGFFGKLGVSWVDFYVASAFLTIKHFAPDFVGNYPELQSHCDRIHGLPQLQSYLAQRKDSPI